ncbi:VOC family protein [Fulvivirgaceae bacterium BMA10]|uniref:VOC family protein n=1 Tax=Splendidivirga corallicola TaxID=3051826 RepID=A0ABT8KSV4_9BACT|nr:VOC family protein [Fulvivirgaceae bacterium BMA10]
MANSINWFELPSKDFERACKFYSDVLGGEVNVVENEGVRMGFLPNFTQDGAVGGCVIHGEGLEPAGNGTMVYLNGGEDLGIPLGKVESAGGKIVRPKTQGPYGFSAVFLDSEGNKVAFHSMG